MSDAQADLAWADEVHGFWFGELEKQNWFQTSADVDRQVADRFTGLYRTLKTRTPDTFVTLPRVALSGIIVLDQFPRNLFRDSPEAFATDALALGIAKGATDAGLDRGLTVDERLFMYLPFEHSEDMADQNEAVRLVSALGDDVYTDFAEKHRDVVARFGRFPHRNDVLGRQSTPEEKAFLADHGRGF
ncbi:MAG: DUF924 family protein [Pseudomonadota bacterium]